MAPANPPTLTAAENEPRDQPKCEVIGTTNTESVATAMTGLTKDNVEAIAKTTQP